MRSRPAVAAILAAILLLGTASCSGEAPEGGEAATGDQAAAAEKPAAGSMAATLAFDGETLDGTPFRGASLAGKPVVLWFWAPWCATCFGQGPTVSNVAAEHGSRVSVVGIAGLGEEPAMREFVRDAEVGAITHINDEAGVIWKRFEVTEQSTYVLLDKAGSVVHKGWLDSQEFTTKVAALAS